MMNTETHISGEYPYNLTRMIIGNETDSNKRMTQIHLSDNMKNTNINVMKHPNNISDLDLEIMISITTRSVIETNIIPKTSN